MTIETHQVKAAAVQIRKQNAGDQIAGYDKEDVYADKAAAQSFGKTMKKENGNNCDRSQTINIGAIRFHRGFNSSGTKLVRLIWNKIGKSKTKNLGAMSASASFLPLWANFRWSVNTGTGESAAALLATAPSAVQNKAFFDPNRRLAAAGVRHHVVLSIVAIERTENGYFRAKLAEEKLIVASGIPYTIIRATQFMEFLRGIADSSPEGDVIRLPPVLFQPIASDDVAAIVAETALKPPRNGVNATFYMIPTMSTWEAPGGSRMA